MLELEKSNENSNNKIYENFRISHNSHTQMKFHELKTNLERWWITYRCGQNFVIVHFLSFFKFNIKL